MSQYKIGTVSVTNGSPIVTGVDTSWLVEVSIGDLFIVVDDLVSYEIANVDTNLQVTLSSNYGGVTDSQLLYAISRDFTPVRNMPYPVKGDIETAILIKRALIILDSLDIKTNEDILAAVETLGLDKLTINNIDKIVATTANLVDVFVYDTSLDSDGGAWRERCSDKSWEIEVYKEGVYLGNVTTTERDALSPSEGDLVYNSTATQWEKYIVDHTNWLKFSANGWQATDRGCKRKLPATLSGIAETDEVTLYDLTDPDVPMWMVFEANSEDLLIINTEAGVFLNKVVMLDGKLLVGTTEYGLAIIDFLSDKGIRLRLSSDTASTARGTYLGNISQRNDGLGFDRISLPGLVNALVNDVTITTLPTSPIDPATGLPKPTIAVATNGGVSVITDDGNVWEITGQSSPVHHITFNKNNEILTGYNFTSDIAIYDIPTTDITNSSYKRRYFPTANVTDAGHPVFLLDSGSAGEYLENAVSSGQGLTLLKENPTTPAEGMVAYITSKYNTGLMRGDIKSCWVPDTDVTSVSNPTAIPDRSVAGNDITVFGTLALNQVASNSELRAFSGFSASNYLEQPYNSDLDFGTGDFYVMGWLRISDVSLSTEQLLSRVTSTSTGFHLQHSSSGFLLYGCGTTSVTSGYGLSSNVWENVAIVRRSGVVSLYLGGKWRQSDTMADNVSNNATLLMGIYYNLTLPADNSDMALWRMGAGVPSAEQIEYIYNTERKMFEPDSNITLDGTSDSVLALDYDEATDILHAPTSTHFSRFQGLTRVSSEATGVGTPLAVSAVNGMIAQAGSTAVDVYVPAQSLREELARVNEQLNYYGQQPVPQRFVGDSVETDFILDVGWIPTEQVYVDGSLVLKGASDEYTLTDDGFLKGLSFAVAPGAVDVVIFAIRGVK